MKWNSIPAVRTIALTAAMMASSTNAKGWLKGADVGRVASHLAGHHGVLAAGAGRVIGHHEASKQARQQTTQNTSSGGSTNNSSGSPNDGSH